MNPVSGYHKEGFSGINCARWQGGFTLRQPHSAITCACQRDTRLHCANPIRHATISPRSKATSNSLMAPARPRPDAQGTGPQHPRDHLRDGDADDARGFAVHRVLALLPVTRAGPIIVAVIVAVVSIPLSAREYRSREVTREFQREHPSPSTGKTSGGCPGYRKDHIKPLACGGPDEVWNLQWQTIHDARAKDRWERRAAVTNSLRLRASDASCFISP